MSFNQKLGKFYFERNNLKFYFEYSKIEEFLVNFYGQNVATYILNLFKALSAQLKSLTVPVLLLLRCGLYFFRKWVLEAGTDF